jgi:DNA ligase 1
LKPFAALLDRLVLTPQRNAKLRLLVDYFATVPDPDRGYGLAALTGELVFKNAKAGLIRELAMARVDPVLFGWSYDFVGDLAETTALVWPARPGDRDWPHLPEVVTALKAGSRVSLPETVEGWLDALDATGRWALLKLITGGLRVGVSARLAKTALAVHGDQEVDAIEEVWHGLEPPYGELFAWLEGRGARPGLAGKPVFRPLMLANPLEDREVAALDLEAYVAEWKWDGIRVQLAALGGEARLYSRTGDDIGASFPEIVEGVGFEGVLDGELLVKRGAEVASFNDLQQRLGRKAPTARLIESHPAVAHLYDILFDGTEDLRGLTLLERRARLAAFVERHRPARLDVPPLVPFATLADLDALRRGCRGSEREGLMLKRKDSAYLAGRPRGPWFKWKRDALTLDCVLMYAQRGHGRRSSFYSDYTFGVWRAKDAGAGEGGLELVPVGKAYFGFTDAELVQLDRHVRDHTTRRYGPVREVAANLVLEIAFDSVHRSTRHKSGVAMRFPRVHRIRWDKPAAEADRLETVERLVE